MKTMQLTQLLAASALALAALSANAAYSNLFIFGDSLSDTGNLSVATGGALPDAQSGPYYQGRYSDGPVWVETLASGLGLPAAATPALLGGNNYAFAGARTGTDSSPPGVLAQIGGLWQGAGVDPNALYVLAAGGNDIRDARSQFQTNSAEDIAGRAAAVQSIDSNLLYSLGLLAQYGAKNVLITSLPNIGNTPEASFLNLVDASTQASNLFNASLPGLIVAGQSYGLNMTFFDMAGLMQNIISDAIGNGGAKYGITNVTSPCAGFAYSVGNSCATSLFSDALHPSAAAHVLIGQAALQAVAPVPEPETYALLALGLVGMLANRRRQSLRI